MEVTDLPPDIRTLVPSREEEGVCPVGTMDAFAAGISAIASAPTVNYVYRATYELAMRLPRVRAVAILHRDDHGLLCLAYNPDGNVPPHQATRAASELHRQWISTHAPGGPASGIRPVMLDASSGLTMVPFARGDSLLGAVLIERESGRPLDEMPAMGIGLAAIGVVVSQALANLVLRHRLRSTVTAAEHDAALAAQAKALGRKLHDGPAQLLALLGMALDRQVKLLGSNEPGSADARQARDLLDRTVDSLRQSISGLRKDTVNQPALSMTGPLRALVAEMDPDSASLEVDVDDVSGVQLTPEVEQALVGITREALHNVRKHARAEMVRLEVHRVGSEVELVVHDDGIGFDGSAPPGHFGLAQIRELAEETGGRIEIGSSIGRGTEVRARIPMSQGAPGIPPDRADR